MNIADNFKWVWEYILSVGEQFRKTPGVFSYYKNWAEQDINSIPKLDENNFKFYVWQTLKFSDNQFYSDEFYIWAIENLLKNTSKDSIILIDVWAELKHIINDDWVSDENRMTTTEQVSYIRNIVKRYFPKDQNRIRINSISETHKELFAKLIESWVYWNNENTQLKINNFNSLDIYNLLYEAIENDSAFFTRIQSTRPTRLKEQDNENSKYYPLVEIAFRITDYINWVYIQWWERRQNIYDVIIRDILSGWYNHIDSIKKIYDFIKFNDIENGFDSIHFNKKKFEKEQERQKWLKKIRNYIWWVSLAISLILWWWVLWAWYVKNQEQQKLQGKIDSAISELSIQMPEFIDTTDSWMRSWGWFKYDKLSFSKFNSEELAKRFISIYWNWDEQWYQFIQLLILETMKSSKNFFDKHHYLLSSSWYDDFLKSEFIKNNKLILLSKWFNLDTYLWEYEKYKGILEDTSSLTEEEIKEVNFWKYLVKDKKLYKSYYSEYDLWFIDCINSVTPLVSVENICRWLKNKTRLLVAKKTYETDYSLEEWKKISQELLSLL